jgi:hypothetical protein
MRKSIAISILPMHREIGGMKVSVRDRVFMAFNREGLAPYPMRWRLHDNVLEYIRHTDQAPP